MTLDAQAFTTAKRSVLSIATAVACALASPASAATLDLHYTYPDLNILGATLTGSVSGNYFTVTGVTLLAVNGASQAAFLQTASIYSADSFIGLGSGYNGDNTAVLALDGSYIDLVITDISGNEGFDFFVNDVYAGMDGNYSAYNIAGAGSDMAMSYDPISYQSSVAVPETASWAMMLVGMAAIGLAMRRRPNPVVTYG